jgi:hypothetical protein
LTPAFAVGLVVTALAMLPPILLEGDRPSGVIWYQSLRRSPWLGTRDLSRQHAKEPKTSRRLFPERSLCIPWHLLGELFAADSTSLSRMTPSPSQPDGLRIRVLSR